MGPLGSSCASAGCLLMAFMSMYLTAMLHHKKWRSTQQYMEATPQYIQCRCICSVC